MTVTIDSYKPYEKNTLRGFVDIFLSNVGLHIVGCTHHSKDGREWVSFPAKQYEKDGETKWQQTIFFDEKIHKVFQRQALDAIHQHIAGGAGHVRR